MVCIDELDSFPLPDTETPTEGFPDFFFAEPPYQSIAPVVRYVCVVRVYDAPETCVLETVNFVYLPPVLDDGQASSSSQESLEAATEGFDTYCAEGTAAATVFCSADDAGGGLGPGRAGQCWIGYWRRIRAWRDGPTCWQLVRVDHGDGQVQDPQ